jgi:hypothetical protein
LFLRWYKTYMSVWNLYTGYISSKIRQWYIRLYKGIRKVGKKQSDTHTHQASKVRSIIGYKATKLLLAS